MVRWLILCVWGVTLFRIVFDLLGLIAASCVSAVSYSGLRVLVPLLRSV